MFLNVKRHQFRVSDSLNFFISMWSVLNIRFAKAPLITYAELTALPFPTGKWPSLALHILGWPWGIFTHSLRKKIAVRTLRPQTHSLKHKAEFSPLQRQETRRICKMCCKMWNELRFFFFLNKCVCYHLQIQPLRSQVVGVRRACL